MVLLELLQRALEVLLRWQLGLGLALGLLEQLLLVPCALALVPPSASGLR